MRPRRWWCFWGALGVLYSCSPNPHAVLVVTDPSELAADAAVVAYGEQLDDLEEIEVRDITFPFDFLLWSTRPKEVPVWVEARDLSGSILARGRVTLALATSKNPQATVELAYVCFGPRPGEQRCASTADSAGSNYQGVCVKNASCEVSRCQDGVLDPNNAWREQCDDGNDSDTDGCRTDCRPNVCGDGVVNPTAELCDDGPNNGQISTTVPFCDPDCGGNQLCGDGFRQGSEVCDDGADNGRRSSTQAFCGPLCEGTQLCGDGKIEGSEVCDDGADNGRRSITETLCGPLCEGLQLCTNGQVEGSESCDDTNTNTGDGCDAECVTEPFRGCVGEPSLCFDALYVDGDAAGGDGSAWATAFDDLHAALSTASAWGQQVEVWVAEGTYLATDADPDVSFGLRNDTHLYGGFAGDEASRLQRTPASHETILSGGDLALYVVKTDGVDGSAVLDGFTVSDSSAAGAGMLNINGSTAVVRNCLFTANHGSGMRNQASSPTVSSSRFVLNQKQGMFNANSPVRVVDSRFEDNQQGGMYNEFNSPVVIASRFAGNRASQGAGMHNHNASPTVVNSRFVGNQATNSGGAMYNQGQDPLVVGCLFAGNTAGTGAGLYNNDAFPLLVNNLFYDNTASVQGGALAISCTLGCQPTPVVNSIMWGNNPSHIHDDPLDPKISVAFSCVEGGHPGAGNIPACNPLFVNPGNEDFRLLAGSPCIDAGDNSTLPADEEDIDDDDDLTEPLPLDLDTRPRLINDLATPDTGNGTPPIVDIGPHEVQP